MSHIFIFISVLCLSLSLILKIKTEAGHKQNKIMGAVLVLQLISFIALFFEFLNYRFEHKAALLLIYLLVVFEFIISVYVIKNEEKLFRRSSDIFYMLSVSSIVVLFAFMFILVGFVLQEKSVKNKETVLENTICIEETLNKETSRYSDGDFIYDGYGNILKADVSYIKPAIAKDTEVESIDPHSFPREDLTGEMEAVDKIKTAYGICKFFLERGYSLIEYRATSEGIKFVFIRDSNKKVMYASKDFLALRDVQIEEK